MNWPHHPRIEITDTSRRRIWQSRCRRFRVIHSRCLYGQEAEKSKRLADRWYAVRYDPVEKMWDIISWHRKKIPAFAACERASAGKR